MTLLETGRLCIKKLGRDAGSKALVTGVVDARFVKIITGKRPKERKCNVSHLEFLNEKVDPKDTAQVNKALGIEKKETHAPAKKAKA
jgi:large subunit ribosomal protein L14e